MSKVSIIATLGLTLVGGCGDKATKGMGTAVDPATASKKSHPRPMPSRTMPSCETASPVATRFRKVRLHGEAPHLGALSEPGFLNVIIIGAEWCTPCESVLREIPRWMSAYPGVVFTYVDIVDEGSSISRFVAVNGLDTIPYAYLANECGYGLSWLKSEVEAGWTLDVKIAAELQRILGPPSSPQVEPFPAIRPEILTMAPPQSSAAPGNPQAIHADTISRSSSQGRPKHPTSTRCQAGGQACVEGGVTPVQGARRSGGQEPPARRAQTRKRRSKGSSRRPGSPRTREPTVLE